jgi:hypothetical protein
MDLDIVGIGGGDQAEEGCTQFDQTEDGTRFYSIVAAADAANGRSIFAIADPGNYSPGECPVDYLHRKEIPPDDAASVGVGLLAPAEAVATATCWSRGRRSPRGPMADRG